MITCPIQIVRTTCVTDPPSLTENTGSQRSCFTGCMGTFFSRCFKKMRRPSYFRVTALILFYAICFFFQTHPSTYDISYATRIVHIYIYILYGYTHTLTFASTVHAVIHTGHRKTSQLSQSE